MFGDDVNLHVESIRIGRANPLVIARDAKGEVSNTLGKSFGALDKILFNGLHHVRRKSTLVPQFQHRSLPCPLGMHESLKVARCTFFPLRENLQGSGQNLILGIVANNAVARSTTTIAQTEFL